MSAEQAGSLIIGLLALLPALLALRAALHGLVEAPPREALLPGLLLSFALWWPLAAEAGPVWRQLTQLLLAGVAAAMLVSAHHLLGRQAVVPRLHRVAALLLLLLCCACGLASAAWARLDPVAQLWPLAAGLQALSAPGLLRHLLPWAWPPLAFFLCLHLRRSQLQRQRRRRQARSSARTAGESGSATAAGRSSLWQRLLLPGLLLSALLLPWLLSRDAAAVGPGPRESGLLLWLALLALGLSGLLGQLAGLRGETRNQPAAPALDVLTGLPNRLGLEQHLGEVQRDSAGREQALALLLVDLDGFNPVNSSFGHDKGDALLRQVAARLRGCLAAGDLVARIGGDEFALLLVGASDKDKVAAMAARIQAELARPYQLQQRDLEISCSVGIAMYPADGGRGRLLACADAAKNAAKRLGGACYCFYAPGMGGDSREQLELLRDLRHAVERRELELFFQPKIDARSGEVTAAEALLRWRHPTRGLVSPVVFIPIAERFGFMRELGNWVIDAACRQARLWRESGLRMRLAINLSAQQMRQSDIVERIQKALERSRVHPTLLTCEITESVVMENTQAIQTTFRRLGELGVHLSIDDFGTGYSSLSYLRQLPAQELKVDRAFVTDLVDSADARAVVEAVIQMAHALGLRVVAEGVETQGQQEVLVAMGCDELQGYLFARPMSAQAILLWAMDEKKPSPAFRASLFGDTVDQDPL